MAMMAGEKIFIDSNVLVYANNSLSPFCNAARTKLQDAFADYDSVWVSRQVFRESALIHYLHAFGKPYKATDKTDNMRTTYADEVGFDMRGNLKPDEKIRLTFDEFLQMFVNPFRHSDSSRMKIFSDYQNFLNDFKALVSEGFVQWVNGSFVSTKQNPNDIDFVTLIDFRVYEEKEQLIEKQFRQQGAKDHYGKVDAYVVKHYPEGHEKHWVTTFDLAYWLDSFGRTTKNRAGQRHPKGFVELNFGQF
jgi:hypothetical protein